MNKNLKSAIILLTLALLLLSLPTILTPGIDCFHGPCSRKTSRLEDVLTAISYILGFVFEVFGAIYYRRYNEDLKLKKQSL